VSKFKVGDRVRIARQPGNQWVGLVGEVGVIEEIHGDLCNIQAYNENGTSGWGTVTLDCLEPYQSPILEQTITRRQAELDRLRREIEERQKRWQKFLTDLSVEFSLPVDTVAEIIRRGAEEEYR